MELPAVVGRRFLAQVAVILLLVSCAKSPAPQMASDIPRSDGARSDGARLDEAGLAGSQPRAEAALSSQEPFTSDIVAASNSSSKTVEEISAQSLNPGDTKLPELTLASNDTATTLTIVSPTGASSATALAEAATTQILSNPNRLVVDFPQSIASKATSRTFSNPNPNYTKQVRVAAYNGKTRIVFDLVEGASITPSVTANEGNIAITLAANRAQSGAASTDAALSNAVISNTDLSSINRTNETATVAAAPEFAATESEPLSARLAAIRFEKTGIKSNQLVLDMDSAGVYSLKRTAPSEFVLRLEDAKLSESANQVLVAPSSEGKIRSVRPTVDGNDIVLRIFSAPDTSLKAESQGGEIVVSTTTLGAEVFADARAQLAPAKDEKKAGETDKAENTGKDASVTLAKDSGSKDGGGDVSELSALLEDQQYTGRLISLDLQDTDIDNALRIIAEVSNLNIVTTEDVQGKITLRLIDVPWDQALDVILKINSLGKVQEGNVVRIAPLEKIRAEREALKQAKQAEEQLEELKVRYMRISYARAADLKPLTESVLSERGTVAYDERSNQIIIKDTKAGISRVVELVRKIDLRTPQVLLETQIVESTRGFQRQLGSRFGFRFVQSPATGNGTGWDFPSSVIGNGTGNNLGGLNETTSPGFLNLLFGSADGTKNLDVTLAAAENEGLAKIISRPSVATTNNKQATIKSVQKLRIKTPSGGTQVAVGQGGQTQGSPVATETIEAGITLDVTPQASPDYYVLLDIKAKSSTFAQGLSVDGIPSEVERSATSTILVSSGQTFVMGGIYKITENNSINGIPFVKDIPVLGHLFRFSDTNNSDEELLFFITPRIVEGSFDDAAMKASL